MFLQLQQQSMLLGRKPVGFAEHYYTEWDDGLGKEKIALFLVLSINSTQVPGAEIGKEAFQLLQDHFLDDLSGDPYDRFENALREVNLMVAEKEKDLGARFVPNMHVICGVIQKDALFLSQRGDAQGYLVRKRHVSSITDGLSDEKNKEDLFQNIASGMLEVGDSVIMVTGPLVQYVTPTDLSKIFSEQSLGEAEKELEDLLKSDIEEQIVMLAFEVLEKSEEMDSVFEGPDGEEAVEKHEAEELAEENERVKRWIKAVKILQEWVVHEDRWRWLKDVRRWEKKKLLTTIAVLVVLVIVSVLALRLFTGKQRSIENMQSKLNIAEENITQAGTRGAFDKEEASVLLTEAENLAVEVLKSKYLGGQASQVLDLVEQQRDYLDNVVHIDDELKMLVDFSSLLGSGKIQGVVPYDDRIVVYTENEAYQVLLGEARSPDTIDTTERVLAASYFENRDNIVMLAASGKVIEYTDGNSQFADTSDVEWKAGTDIASYSSRIYVLDPGSNQIWKYQRGSSGYSSAVGYLASETELDLSKAISIAIDGNVWVLLEGGELMKLLSGENVPFLINKAPLGNVSGVTQVYTELEIKQLYLVDPDNDRLLVYNKSSKTDDITYSQQYVFDALRGELVDMYVDKDRDVVVFVTDSALYELGF